MKFIIFPGKNHKYYWRLHADNGKILSCTTRGYESEFHIRESITNIIKQINKINAIDPKEWKSDYGFEYFQDFIGAWRYTLWLTDDEIPRVSILLKSSEGYKKFEDCEKSWRLTRYYFLNVHEAFKSN